MIKIVKPGGIDVYTLSNLYSKEIWKNAYPEITYYINNNLFKEIKEC